MRSIVLMIIFLATEIGFGLLAILEVVTGNLMNVLVGLGLLACAGVSLHFISKV